MSGYGYESYGYGYVSYGSAYGGYGYYSTFLGSYNTARGELTGPGSSAFEQDGNTTSYASENYNGGVFEQTTFVSGSHYEVATSYIYASGYYYYGSDYGAVGTGAFFNNNSYSSYSVASGNGIDGLLDYSFSSSQHSAYGGYDQRTTLSFSDQNFADGSYYTSTTSRTGSFTYEGQLVPGTSSSYSAMTHYDGSTGYMTSYHTP